MTQKIHSMTPHFSRGSSNAVAFVFSCPGRVEKLCRHPAAGRTGRNLEALLEVISTMYPGLRLTRKDITISNAWDQVEYLSETGRTEASDEQVRSIQNIERLAGEILHVTGLVVFCGDKARLAATEIDTKGLLSNAPRFAYLGHLGTRGLNAVSHDTNGAPILSAVAQKTMGAQESVRTIQRRNTSLRLSTLANQLKSDFDALRCTLTASPAAGLSPM